MRQRSRMGLVLAVLVVPVVLAGCGTTEGDAPPESTERENELSPDATQDFIRRPEGFRGGRFR